MPPIPVVFDVTFYETDGETPLFGSAYAGAIVESDFQVPNVDLPHDRPYLDLPLNAVASETNFIEGSSRIGSVQLRILDKDGILTEQLRNLRGHRAVWRRWIDGAWRVRIDGVVFTTSIDQETLVHHVVELRDGRQFEKAQPLFVSSHVLFGLDGANGPAVDYGRQPSGEYLLRGIEPHPTSFREGPDSGEDGVYWGTIDLPAGSEGILGDLGNPVHDALAGLWRHEDYQVWWRESGPSPGAYRKLRNMVRPRVGGGAHAITLPLGSFTPFPEDLFASYFSVKPQLFLSSDDPDDIPSDEQEIDVLVLAVGISPDTPFWWDNGTVGDLLEEIVAGEHTEEPPLERYDSAELAAFAAAAPAGRVFLDRPVADRRRWAEENIYQPSLRAPGFSLDRELRPVSWEPPDAETGVPILDGRTLQPIGDLLSSMEGAIGAIEFTYIREYLDPKKTRDKKVAKKFLGITYGHKLEQVVDDARADWERLVRKEVTVRIVDPDAAPGSPTLYLAPVTIRSIGSSDGRAPDGDVLDELGNQIANRWAQAVFPRRRRGTRTLEVDAVATDANLQRLQGDFVRLRAEWLPDETDGVVGLREIGQIAVITESEDPSKVRFKIDLLDIPDRTADDDEEGTGVGGEDCLVGGTLHPAAGGLAVREFRTPGRFTIENTCDHPVVCGLVAVAGGGGGGTTGGGGGGGGGAGGVLGGDGELEITIPANSTVTIDVGAGGGANASGDDSIVWIHNVTGDVLDPDVDDPDDAFRAIGGGGGDGDNGGSGGGGSAEMPLSGGATHGGGSGTAGQGNDGGDGVDAGGIATCQRSAGGGGGSYGGVGTAGVIPGGPLATPPVAGEGGPSSTVPGWGITLGGGGQGGTNTEPQGGGEGTCGAAVVRPGSSGASGWGYGGGGGADGGGAGAGGPGGVALRYAGPAALLQPPTITSVEIDEQNQAVICVEGNDFPPGDAEGLQVRAEYALAATEPDPASTDWRFAAAFDAPGCVTTPPVTTGAKVWARARTEATGQKPSAWSAAVDADAPETPGALRVTLTVTPQGVATLEWEPNAFSGAQKIRGLIHDEGDSTARPLAMIDATVVPGDSPYTLPGTVEEEQYYTIDLEFWEDGTYAVQGRTERRSVQNPQRTLVTRDDGLDALSDVNTTGAEPEDLLILNEYGEWVPISPAELVEILPNPSSDGWTEIIAETDQDVTNNSTLQDDAELTFPVVDLGLYHWELFLAYAGSDATVDFKLGASFPSQTGQTRYMGQNTASAINASSGVFHTGVTSITPIAFGTNTSFSPRIAQVEGSFRSAGDGDFKIQFANNTAAVGAVSRRLAGTLLRYRRIK